MEFNKAIEVTKIKKILCKKPCDSCKNYGKRCAFTNYAEKIYDNNYRDFTEFIDTIIEAISTELTDLYYEADDINPITSYQIDNRLDIVKDRFLNGDYKL